MPWNDTMWLSLRINQYGIVDARENLVLISYMIIYNIGDSLPPRKNSLLKHFLDKVKIHSV